MISLPAKQAEVYGILKARIRAGLPMPSRREIARELKVSSLKTVNDHLRALKKKGVITWEAGKARALRICKEHAQNSERELMSVPIFGAIAAGFPEASVEMQEEFTDFDPTLIGLEQGKSVFALIVRGESMRDRHILEGDVVMLERDANPRPGDVVAALIDQESTLKTLVEEDGEYWLKAENPNYPDLIPAESLEIQGVARAIMRRLP